VSSSPLEPIRIVTERVALHELRDMAARQFGDFVKAVVDLERAVMAIGGELHADEEAFLLQGGARQAGNRSRGVEDAAVQRRIQAIVERLVAP
jgi:hypothetical protein